MVRDLAKLCIFKQIIKFRNLAKLYIFKLIMTKSDLKNSYDVSLVTPSPLRPRKTPPK